MKSMVLTDTGGRVPFCSPVLPGSCTDITQARRLGLAQLPACGPFLEILADAGYQGMGAQRGGGVVTPPHHKFKKNPPAWSEERHEQRRKAHSSQRIRVEQGIAHMKTGGLWPAILADANTCVTSSRPSPVCSRTCRPPPSAAGFEREHRQRHTPRRAKADRARGRQPRAGDR
ncbi:hypothetical protein GCM10023335_67080 [Streptomyces siamensis]|uniref:DDE Tnp4 domain-containing protein n=1 Tax=Streptomyces siamensis TaxID=1274986 RepID=A0ABP9JFM8_9ACTN